MIIRSNNNTCNVIFMIHQEITDKQWKSIEKHLPKPEELEDQDVMTESQSMELCLFKLLGVDGRNCQKNMVLNQLHISDYKTGSKKEFGKRFSNVQLHLHINQARSI